MNNQSDNITTASISSTNKNEPKLKSLAVNDAISNSSFIVINKKNNQLEFKTITTKYTQEHAISNINFVRPADPLLKRTKVPKVKPKLGKLKSYM
jgi:hypothetical protein